MKINGCVAMVLAGGRGERLGSLTRYYSKPAVHFGGKHRIIDFTLRNCSNSGIDTIGVLSQHSCIDLHAYIETAYDRKFKCDGIHLLPPQYNDFYKGTADAVYKNIRFIERFKPEYVLVLASDHVYDMDYGKMIKFHRKTGANVTVASTYVPIKEASRFGILNVDKHGRVIGFDEKPERPRSNLASMGIYVFNWDVLQKYLRADSKKENTQHDFGADILPEMLRTGELVYRYCFDDYWQDVGTVDGLLEASIEHIDRPCALGISGSETIESEPNSSIYNSLKAEIVQSVVSEGCSVFGRVEHSVLGNQVTVGKGAEVVGSYVMPGAYIGNNSRIYNAVIGAGAIIMDHIVIGADNGPDLFIDSKVCEKGVSLVSPWLYITGGMKFKAGSHIYEERLQKLSAQKNDARCTNAFKGIRHPFSYA